jgi:penicillin amidase
MLEHPVGAVRALAPIFNRGPFPWGGDGGTVSQAGTTVLNAFANPNAIASVRVVIDVGEWENSRFVLPGGQSGNPFSTHYDDLLPLWLRGDGVPIAWSPDAVAAATRHTLKLEPLTRRA